MNNFVFQIGFNKCGTRSLYNLFSESKIPSLHWHNDHGKLPKLMLHNFFAGRPLIPLNYEEYVFFSDLEDVYHNKYLANHSYYFYQHLYNQYPNSKFILNIRPLDDWLNSRLRHDDGKYLKQYMQTLSLNKSEVIDYWVDHFNNHIQSVKDFFLDKPNKLIIFNIATDKVDKLIKFFPDFNLRCENWKQIR